MMPWLLPFTNVLAFLKGVPRWAWFLVGIVALYVGFQIWDYYDDRAAVHKAVVVQQAKENKSKEEASVERTRDIMRNLDNEKELLNVVEKAPEGELSPAARAVACERLRRLGRIPPACRPEGNNGAEADSK